MEEEASDWISRGSSRLQEGRFSAYPSRDLSNPRGINVSLRLKPSLWAVARDWRVIFLLPLSRSLLFNCALNRGIWRLKVEFFLISVGMCGYRWARSIASVSIQKVINI